MAEKDAPTLNPELVNAVIDAVAQGTEETKSRFRNAIGASGVVQRQAPLQNNADAKRIAYTVGEILQPPDFVPEPSESLVQSLGYDRAKQTLAERYNRNKNASGAHAAITGRDAEQMQMQAGVPAPPGDIEALAETAVE